MTRKESKEVVRYVMRKIPQLESCVFVIGKKHNRLLAFYGGKKYEIVIASTPGDLMRFRYEVAKNVRRVIPGL